MILGIEMLRVAEICGEVFAQEEEERNQEIV